MMKPFVVYLTLAVLVVLTGTGCSSHHTTPVSETQKSRAPAPKSVTTADLAKLRWIEGTWRGTGDIDKPFYERYHLENDSALVMEELDETLTRVKNVSRYELKNGQFSNGSYVATEFDDKSITFSPLKAKEEVRAITLKSGTCASRFSSSSAMPSAKYS